MNRDSSECRMKIIYRDDVLPNRLTYKRKIRRGEIFFFLMVLKMSICAAHTATAQPEEEQNPVIWSVSFEGNENYSNIVLREVVGADAPSFFRKIFRKNENYLLNETELKRDRIRILRYYQRRGFYNADVQYEIQTGNREWKKKIVFMIEEGKPMMITSSAVTVDADESTVAEITESRDFVRARQRHDYQTGERYESIREADVEGLFLRVLENMGYAWPEVNIQTEADSISGETEVDILIRPNVKTYFSDIEIEGELSVPERVVRREADIAEGELYRRDKMQDAQRQIFNHHLFRFATVTVPDQPADSTINLLIRVREHPLRTIQTTFGVGREEWLRGQVGWQHRNINGKGHRLGARARASFIDQRLGVDYLIPYVFNPKSSYISSLFGQHRLEPAYELFQAGVSNSLIYQARQNATMTASYEFTKNEELSRERDVSLPDSVINYNISSLSFSGYYREGLSREQQGWVIQPFAEFSGTFGESSYKFQKFSLDVRRYTPVTNSLTVAARLNAGAIFYTQPDSLPSNIRFYSGGTNSVRGWTRQSLGPGRPGFDDDGEFSSYVPVGGRAMFTFNLELRKQLSGFLRNVGLAAFLDGGQVWRSVSRMEERPVQFGAGGGFRYQSPIGPVRVDVAYKLNPTEQDLNIYNGRDYGSPWDRIGIHFSIGQAF